MSDPGFTRPDLAPLHAAASQAEFAEAVRGLVSADGYPLADDDPLAPLARDVARSLVEAGFTLHHCDRHDPLYRLGGVCLMPIPAESGTGYSGIAVSWTTHNLLLFDWDRYGTYHRTLQLMNATLAGILHAFGYSVQQLGTGGAWLVTDHCAQKATGAGR
jgi:hypothetical protein